MKELPGDKKKIVIKKKDEHEVPSAQEAKPIEQPRAKEVQTVIDTPVVEPEVPQFKPYKQPPNYKQIGIISGSILFVLILLFVFLRSCGTPKEEEQPATKAELDNIYETASEVSNKEMTLAQFLEEKEVAATDIEVICKNAKRFDFEAVEIGDKITYAYKNKASNLFHHILFDTKAHNEKTFKINLENLSVVAIRKEVNVKYRYGYVVIDSGLFEAVMTNNLPWSLLAKMEEILGYSVDFFHLNKGDIFKIIFTEKIANNQSLGVDKIVAIQYIGLTKKVEAFSYEKGDNFIYIDQFGKDLKKAFLLSPLKYGRLTSSFSSARLHPVTGELKGHFGTDYAAPEGTEILAVADGVIEKYETNGNYAKVRHDKTYESQYLHMSAFVDGMKVGTKVRQGQVIGFVGQTGLATGPHVCFRFWKNGTQINHLEENLPSGNQMLSNNEKQSFDTRRDSLMAQLKNINGVN